MNIMITGIPAVGKSTIAKELAKYGFNVYNDKDFITKTNSKEIKEYNHKLRDVNLVPFAKTVNSKLKTKKNVILEGIIFPYCLKNLTTKLDYIFVLSLPEKKLRLRYKARKYPEAKILDNLFVQENNLIYKQILESCNVKRLPVIAEITLSGNTVLDITKVIEVIFSTFSSI